MESGISEVSGHPIIIGHRANINIIVMPDLVMQPITIEPDVNIKKEYNSFAIVWDIGQTGYGPKAGVANQEKNEWMFHSMSRSFCLEFLNALYHVTSRGGRRETFIKAM